MQIDLRFTNPEQGSLAVVVAPVLRFQDVGFNADIRIEELGPPEKLIGGFAPELFGSPLQVCVRTSSSYQTACLYREASPLVWMRLVDHCAQAVLIAYH